MRSNPRVFIALILSMIFWSFSYVWVKMAYESFLPMTTIFLRLILSTLLMSLLVIGMRKLQPIAREDRKWFLLMAFFEPFLYYMGESYGLKYVPSTLAAVIIATIPLFTPVLAYAFYREKLSTINVIGIFVSIGGVALIVAEKTQGMQAPLKGILLMFFAVAAALFYGLLLRKLAGKYNPFTIVTVQNGIGIVMFLPFFLMAEWSTFIHTIPTTKAITAVVLLAIFASSLAFMLFAYSINQIGLSRANVFTNAIPAMTAIIAWWLLKESLTAQKIMGIVIVMLGLYVTQIKPKPNAV